MVETMRAQRFYAETKSVVLEDVPIPDPGPGEVLVKVAFCGICHSDLSLANGTFPAQRPVVTQGHEASGTIAKLGPGVTGWSEGDRVVVVSTASGLKFTELKVGTHEGTLPEGVNVRAPNRPTDLPADVDVVAEHLAQPNVSQNP